MTTTEQTYSRIGDLIADSDEILSIVPVPSLNTEFIRTSRGWYQEALRSKVVVHALYLDTVIGHHPSITFIEETVAAGAQARTLPFLPSWLTVIGRTTVVFPRDPQHLDMGTFLVHSRGPATLATWAFQRAWTAARPVDLGRQLCEWEQRVIDCLAAGVKDESAARILGVSPRTYRRHVTRLCQRLGASSRFQAGLRAAKDGMI